VDTRAAPRNVDDADLDGAIEILALLLDALDIAGLLQGMSDVLGELGIRYRNDGFLGVGAILDADYEV